PGRDRRGRPYPQEPDRRDRRRQDRLPRVEPGHPRDDGRPGGPLHRDHRRRDEPVAAHSLRGRDGVGGTGGARARRRTVGERLTAVSASLATKPSTGTQGPGGRPAPLHRPAALGALWLGGLVALLVSVAVVITIGPSGITAGDVVQSALARVTGADSGL